MIKTELTLFFRTGPQFIDDSHIIVKAQVNAYKGPHVLAAGETVVGAVLF